MPCSMGVHGSPSDAPCSAADTWCVRYRRSFHAPHLCISNDMLPGSPAFRLAEPLTPVLACLSIAIA